MSNILSKFVDFVDYLVLGNVEYRDECTVITSYNIKPNSKEKFIEFMKSESGIVLTRKSNGCFHANLYEDIHNDDTIFVIEQWENPQKHQSYLNSTMKETFDKIINEYMADDIHFTYMKYNSDV
tara:strand:- start:2835 stop:3206 length:372 start_codon:yes stop_codon:yes gene_type:complete